MTHWESYYVALTNDQDATHSQKHNTQGEWKISFFVSSRLPLFLKALSTSSKIICFCFFPMDEIYEPFCNSMDISKSPHLVKRLDTKDPNGSTVAPALAKLKINCEMCR